MSWLLVLGNQDAHFILRFCKFYSLSASVTVIHLVRYVFSSRYHISCLVNVSLSCFPADSCMHNAAFASLLSNLPSTYLQWTFYTSPSPSATPPTSSPSPFGPVCSNPTTAPTIGKLNIQRRICLNPKPSSSALFRVLFSTIVIIVSFRMEFVSVWLVAKFNWVVVTNDIASAIRSAHLWYAILVKSKEVTIRLNAQLAANATLHVFNSLKLRCEKK